MNFIIAILLGIASIQGLFLVFALMVEKKGRKKITRIGIVLVLSITLIIFQNFIGFSGLYKHLPHSIFLFYSLNGIIGPIFLYYIVNIIEPDRKGKWYDFLHLIVFFILLVQQIPFLFSHADYKIRSADNVYFSETVISVVGFVKFTLIKLFTLAYPLLAIYILNKKITSLTKFFANTQIEHMKWLKSFSIVFALFHFLVIVACLVNFISTRSIYFLEIVIHVINGLFIHFLVFMVIKQPEKLRYVFNTNGLVDKVSLQKWPIKRLTELMAAKKPFLNPDIKLHDVAAMLEVPPHSLSTQLNQQLGLNFYEFINKHRVEEFKKRMLSNQFNHYTILAVAYDVGFNSKASFNRVFKKYTGHTPSQYLSHKKVPASKIETIGTGDSHFLHR